MPSLFDIPEFRQGQDLRESRAQLNAMRRAIIALQPCSSADIKPNCTERGTTYNFGRRIMGGGASVGGSYPFDITITETAGPVYTATFRAGTINSLLPDNYLTGVTVPATGTRYLVLSITVSSGAITGATFSADTTPPDAIAPYAGEPPTAFDILIGVVVDTVATKVWGNGNIQALAAESFRLQKVTPVAGQVPYDVYYTWNLAVL